MKPNKNMMKLFLVPILSLIFIYGCAQAPVKEKREQAKTNYNFELKDYLLQVTNEWKLNNLNKVLNYEYFKDANTFQKELISDYKYLSHLKTNLDEYYMNQTHLFTLEVALSKFDITMFEYKPPKEFEQLYSRYPFMKAFHCTMPYPDKIRLIQYLDMS